MAETVRVQLGRSDTLARSRLFGSADQVEDELIRSIRKASGHGEMRWQAGDSPGQVARNVEEGAAQMVKAAIDATQTLRIRTIPGQDSGLPAVHLWVLSAERHDISGAVPAAATTANGAAIAAMLSFHEELTFVFPEYKTLGGYVPRPVKSQIPAGWSIGDPWPMFDGRLAFASEHAWGDGVDAGKSNGQGGFDQGPTLKPLLGRITEYTLANRERLGLVDHIFDHKRHHERDNFEETEYTGSDPHDTHTHTAFGEHDGLKPPWL